MHLTKFAALPVELTLGGVTYRVGKLRVKDVAVIERWLVSIVAHAEGCPVDATNRPTMASRVGLLLLDTGEGTARVVHASLSQTIPGFTIQDARDLVNSLGREQAEAIVAAAFPEPDDDPEPAKDRPRDPRGMNWHAGVLMLAERFKYTDEYILDMPLDRFFGMCQDIKDVQPKLRKKWARRFVKPGDLDEYGARLAAKPESMPAT